MKKDITVQELKKDIYRQVKSAHYGSKIEFRNLNITGRNYTLEKKRFNPTGSMRVEIHFIGCIFENSFSFNNAEGNNFDLGLRGCSFKRDIAYRSNGLSRNQIYFEDITVEGEMSISGATVLTFLKVTADKISLGLPSGAGGCSYIHFGEMKMREITIDSLIAKKVSVIDRCHESLVGVIGKLFPGVRIADIYTQKGTFFGSNW